MGRIDPERLKKKVQIILDMYNILTSGGKIDKKKYAEKEKISIKTVGRYLEDINYYLESYEEDSNSNVYVDFDDKRNGYILKGREKYYLTKEDILALAKVLFESKGFSNKELSLILNKLVANCVVSDKSLIESILLSEKQNYIEPRHKDENLIMKLWDLSSAVRKNKVVNIDYLKLGNSGELIDNPIKRKILPLGIIFSEYYFYVLGVRADVAEINTSCYIPYRIDRIKSYDILEDELRNKTKEKFEEGEFRQVTQFMQPENLERIKFKFKGRSVEAILDRIPTAKIVSKADGEFIIEAKVYTKGVKMFLLSQGEAVEVLEPVAFRNELKETIESMMGNYL